MSALNQGRYKWCHDKVLAVLANILEQEPIHTSVHPAIFFCLSEVESQWQQARHRIPVILFLSSVFVVPPGGGPKTLKMIYIVYLPQMPEKKYRMVAYPWLCLFGHLLKAHNRKLTSKVWPSGSALKQFFKNSYVTPCLLDGTSSFYSLLHLTNK